MKILAIDTATEACSVALFNEHKSNDNKGSHKQTSHNENAAHGEVSSGIDITCSNIKTGALDNIDSIFEVCPQQHSQQILPMIDTLLRQHDLLVSDLSAIAYGCGPGSFTGVRIAASTVQGLAFGANLPVVQVSTLAAMAQQVYASTGVTEILVLIDARMKEVYMGHFTINSGIAVPLVAQTVLSPEDALAYLHGLPKGIGLAGTGFETYATLFHEALQLFTLDVYYPNAKYMIAFAQHAINNNSTITVDDIAPVYVRDTVTWKKLPHKE